MVIVFLSVKCYNFHCSYVFHAVKAIPEISLSPEELENERIMEMLKDWYKVVLLYSLKLMIAPVIETAILIDRCVFLKESCAANATVEVLPIFDAAKSPRNFAIIATKDKEL